MAQNSLCNVQYAVVFVKTHEADCQKIASDLQVPVENILGLAAHESWYGKGRIADKLNNYFSMHAPSKYQIGFEAPLGDPKGKVSRFKDFKACADSFADRFGDAVTGKKDPADFAQALIRKGFNSGKASNGGSSSFARDLVNIIGAVKVRLAC